MTFFYIMGTIIMAGVVFTIKAFRPGGFYNPILPEIDPKQPATPMPAPISNITATPATATPVPLQPLLWDMPKDAFHATRVVCDEMGLTVEEKNLICAVIYGESEFKNAAKCYNKDKQGNITSVDVGICQWNSYWHTGEGKTFPSTDYIIAHPEEAVRKMIEFYNAGHINLWVAHKTGRYLQFLKPTSAMWKLKS